MPQHGILGFLSARGGRWFVLSALLCGGARGGWADHTEDRADEYQQRIWRKEHGLPGNTVTAILQTRDGYLWVGTTEGLARFDGMRFAVFNPLNVPAFRSPHCTALAEDAEGTLWIGTANGLLQRREGRFIRVGNSDELDQAAIRTLRADPAGTILVKADRRLLEWRDGRFLRLSLSHENKEVSVADLHIDETGKILATTGLGLCEWNAQTGRFDEVLPPDALARLDPYIDKCLRTADGWFWFYCDSRLAFWRGDQLVVHTNRHPESSPNTTLFVRSRAGDFWIGNERRGLFRFREGRFSHYDRASGLSDGWVSSYCEDREGNLWFGTEAGGLNRWQPMRFASITTREGLPHENVWALCEGRDGSVWIGTDGGVSRLKNGAFTTFDTRHGLSRNTVRALGEDRSGALWIGTGNGLNKLLDGKLTVHPLPVARWGDKIRALHEDRSGALWVGWEHGLARLKDGVWTQFSSVEELQSRAGVPPAQSPAEVGTVSPANPHSSLDVRAILEDRRGALWLGTLTNGLIGWRDGEASVFTTQDGLASDTVWALHEDAAGALWIGTAAGLNRLANGRLHRFTTREGLPDDLVNQILEDDSGHLWISHDRGLYRVSKRALDDVATGRARAVECATYDEADGMPSRETNGAKSQPAGIKTRDGRLWFPTTRGVAVIDPRTMIAPEAPPVVIESVRAVGNVVFGEETISGVCPSPGAATRERQSARDNSHALGQAGVTAPEDGRGPLNRRAANSELQLAPGSGRLVEIQYTANSFAAPEKIRFQYRLRGYDTNWTDADHRRAASFTNLRPGGYQFEVRARTHDGAWSETRAVLPFHVAPFWYQRRSVQVLAALALVAASWSVYRRRLAELRQRHELQTQNARADERVRVAADLHDDLGGSITEQIRLIERAHPGADGPAGELLGRLGESTRELARKTKEIIWVTSPACDTLEHLASYLSQYAGAFLASAGVAARFDVPVESPPLLVPGRLRHQVFLIAKEALSNAVKHARAREVWLRLRVESGAIRLVIEDSGCGFDITAAHAGHGLVNMRRRAAEFGGSIEWQPTPGGGTTVRLTLPLQIENRKSCKS